MPRVEVALTITVHSALAARGGPDSRGRTVIRASQVKGRLRHSAEQVARALDVPICRSPRPATMCPNASAVAVPPCPVCALFGAPAWPSPLRWHDLHATLEPADERGMAATAVAVRSGVALDRRLGTGLLDSAYELAVSPVPSSQGLRFAAEPAITGELTDTASLQLLLAACRLVAGFGAGQSRGLGWSTVEATARLAGEPYAFDPAALGRLSAAVTSQGR